MSRRAIDDVIHRTIRDVTRYTLLMDLHQDASYRNVWGRGRQDHLVPVELGDILADIGLVTPIWSPLSITFPTPMWSVAPFRAWDEARAAVQAAAMLASCHHDDQD